MNKCIERNYKIFNEECFEECPNNTINQEGSNICLCDIKCGNCSLESSKYNLCISCNINNNFYQKLNYFSNYNFLLIVIMKHLKTMF